MKTVYGKLTALLFFCTAAMMLFLPMRSGTEDHLYAKPRSLRMKTGDSYTVTYELDAPRTQSVGFTSMDETVATVSESGRVTAMAPGETDLHLLASGGARTTVHVTVVGTPTTQLQLNTDYVRLEKGDVTGLSAAFNENASDTRIEWRSMDPAIAQVNNVGRVTATRGGTTQVCAVTPSGLSAAATVFVHVPGDAVRIRPENLTLGVGAQLNMGTTFFPDDCTDVANSWTSSDSHVLEADDDGTIRAVGVGQAILSVFSGEGLSTSAIINVEPSADRFELNPAAVTIERGDSLTIEPRFLDAEGNEDAIAIGHYIEWTSSDPTVASVENGRVIGHKSGKTRITAVSDGMTSTCDLTVQVLVHEITLDQDEVYLLREQTEKPIQLTATISPADPDDPTITYTTSNDLVAKVGRDGLVTLTGGYGTAVITAQAASGATAHFTVNVVVKMPEPTEEPLPEGSEAGTPVESGSFDFGDIGNTVSGEKTIDENGNVTVNATPVPAPAATQAPATGGFSFSDIGNTVTGNLPVNADGTLP